MSRIFINYRRGDTSANASRLYEWLSERYGEEQVFMDVDAIEPGRPWREAIDSAVGSSDLVLALIGRDWMTELRRRLDDTDDFMRHELETAFRRGVRIIPVLVEGAEMPRQSELPDTLAQLSEYQAFVIRNERWEWDKQELLRRVDRALAVQPEAAPSPPPPQKPVSPPAEPVSPPAQPKAPLDGDLALETELKKWNWGAFLLTWIWGLGHGVYRSFLTLIPIYGLYEWYMLGRNGNRLAWENRRWDSVESFRSTQRKWAMWGIIVGVVLFIIVVASTSSSG